MVDLQKKVKVKSENRVKVRSRRGPFLVDLQKKVKLVEKVNDNSRGGWLTWKSEDC